MQEMHDEYFENIIYRKDIKKENNNINDGEKKIEFSLWFE
jgi:hypothetical protein